MFSGEGHPYNKLLTSHEKQCTSAVSRAALLACCSLLNTRDLNLVSDASAEKTGGVVLGAFQAELTTISMRHKQSNTLVEVVIVRSGPEHITVIISPTNGNSAETGITPTAQVLNIARLVDGDATTAATVEEWTPKFFTQLRGDGSASTASVSVGGSTAQKQREQDEQSQSETTTRSATEKKEDPSKAGFGDVKPGSFDDFQRSQARREEGNGGVPRYGESDLAPGGGAAVGPGFAGQGGRGTLGGGNYAGPESNLFQPGGGVGTAFGRHDPPTGGPGGVDPFSANPNPDHAPLMGVPRGPGGRPLGGGPGRGGFGAGSRGGFGQGGGNYFM